MSIVGTDVFLLFPRAETTTKVGGSPNVRQWSHPVIRTISCTGEGAGRGVNNIKN